MPSWRPIKGLQVVQWNSKRDRNAAAAAAALAAVAESRSGQTGHTLMSDAQCNSFPFRVDSKIEPAASRCR